MLMRWRQWLKELYSSRIKVANFSSGNPGVYGNCRINAVGVQNEVIQEQKSSLYIPQLFFQPEVSSAQKRLRPDEYYMSDDKTTVYKHTLTVTLEYSTIRWSVNKSRKPFS